MRFYNIFFSPDRGGTEKVADIIAARDEAGC